MLLIFAGGMILLVMHVYRNRGGGPENPVTTGPAGVTPAAIVAPPPAPTPNQDAQTPPPKTVMEEEVATAEKTPPPPETAIKAADRAFRMFHLQVKEDVSFALGSVDPESGFLCKMELVGPGAAIKTLKLTNHYATVDDKQLVGQYEDDHAAYQAERKEDPQKYKGHYRLLNPIDRAAGPPMLSLATGKLTVSIPSLDEKDLYIYLDRKDDDGKAYWGRAKDSTGPTGDVDSASFVCKLYRGKDAATARPLLEIVKTYTLAKDDYTFVVDVSVKNLSRWKLNVELDQLGPMGAAREGTRRDMRKAAYGKYVPTDQAVAVSLLDAKDTAKAAAGDTGGPGASDGEVPTLWIGNINKFFGSMMYLVPTIPDRLPAARWKARFYADTTSDASGSPAIFTGVRIPDITLNAGDTRELSLEVFAGPKKRDLFSNDQAEHFRRRYEQLNYISTIDFGGCFCTWAALSLGMMWLLQTLAHHVTFGNYGVAIFVLVVMVRLVLHPLTKRGQVSMMKMQKLAPQMQKLKEKYADDKNALNKEMMKAYREQGATPILGCLPMLLQMPIWVALFTSLNATVELRHAAFLPIWITDLTSPDALFSWSRSLPLIGNSFNLLPLLLTVAMFLQTKMNPQMGQVAARPEQAQQQKMMKYMMPVMMLVFFYHAASGLTLYIMASTFAGVTEQMVIRRHIRQREALEAAMETTVRLPGKVARDSRPKKPKGPFWTKGG